ncbi:MAG TPA: DUF2155 domain-containing protein [Methylocystis sp.]|jgi:hypothetical protein
MKLPLSLAPAAVGVWAFFAVAASAEPIRHPTAIFAGLDKTTGRIINFDVAIDETVQFGTLQVTPRVCNTRPQTETPQTTSFVEVDELILKPERRGEPKPESVKADAKQEAKRVFSGWMFAASPGLHGVEHPVYDVWLVDCKGGKETVAPPAEAAAPAAPAAEAEATVPPEGGKKRRSRRVEPTAPAPIENQPIGPADQAAPAPVDPEAGPAPADASATPPTGGRKKKRRRGEQVDPAAAPPPAGNPLFPF